MRIIRGLLFVHPSMGLGIVTSISSDSASVSFADYPGRSYLIALNYIKTVYSSSAVEEQVKSVRDIIRKDLLDDFFTAATRAKGHAIYNNKDPIMVYEEKDDSIKANIVGTAIYDTEITYVDGVVRMYCSCPVQGECKHLFALTDYIKHEKQVDITIERRPKSIYQVNEELEKEFEPLPINEYSFEYLERINKLLDRLCNYYSAKDIAEYFAGHSEIRAYTQDLEYRLCYFNEALFSKLMMYVREHHTLKGESPFLNSLEKNHESVIDSLYSRYYDSNIMKKRENNILYYCLNKEFEDASSYLSEPNFTLNSLYVVAYYFEELFNASFQNYKNHIRPLFRNRFQLIKAVYDRTNNYNLQKTLYLDFYEDFAACGVSRDDISSIDLFAQMVDKKERLTSSKKRQTVIDLAIKCIEEGHEEEVVSLVFMDLVESRNPFFESYMRKEIIKHVSNNELLMEIIDSSRGGYDYY